MTKKHLTREEKRLRRYNRILDAATILLAIFAILLMMFALRGCTIMMTAEASAPAAKTVRVHSYIAPATPAEWEPKEDPREQELIYEALAEDGYFSDSIPLSYDLQDTLSWACEVNGIPFCVGLGLIETESSFNIYAKSKAGCYGLCQLNPTYFPADLDAHGNISAGMEYLGKLIKRYDGDLPAALRAYNRGYDDGWRGYSNAVLANAAKWCEILDMEAKG